MRLQKGDVVILKDEQSLKDNVNGLELRVLETREFINDLTKWEVYTLENELFLVYQEVGQNVEVGVYFYAEKFTGNRKDMMENGLDILFENSSLDSFYSIRIKFENSIEFIKKLHEMPCQTNDGLFALVVEWEAPNIENNQLMVTEAGEGPEGGLITFLRGSHVDEHEIEILRRR